MEPTVFYVHDQLRQGKMHAPLAFSRDYALASLWLGMNTHLKPKATLKGASIQNVLKGIKHLKETQDISRYVFLTGPDKEKMATFITAQDPKDLIEVTRTPFAIRLGMQDALRPTDRIAYLAELKGVIIQLHRLGLYVYENNTKTRIYAGETVPLYGLLDAIPTLSYEDYTLIQLFDGVHEEIMTDILPYLQSKLVKTTVQFLEASSPMDVQASRNMFKDLLSSQPISRIHYLSFQTARLLIH